MGNRLNSEEIIGKTLDAIIHSHELYLEFSGNEWLWNAPEYLITVKIAEFLHSIEKNKFITLEDSVDYILKEANAHSRKKIRHGRFDIVLWWAKGDPRAIIEVKNGVHQFRNIEEDIERVEKVLTRKEDDSSIKFGLIAFYVSKHYKNNTDEKINNLIENLYFQTQEKIPKLKVSKYYKIVYDKENEPNDIFAAVVFKIQR